MSRVRVVDDRMSGYLVYRIVWVLSDEEAEGAYIGDVAGREDRPEPTDPEAWDCWTADRVAKVAPGTMRDPSGFWWERRGQADVAARLVRAALKKGRTT